MTNSPCLRRRQKEKRKEGKGGGGGLIRESLQLPTRRLLYGHVQRGTVKVYEADHPAGMYVSGAHAG